MLDCKSEYIPTPGLCGCHPSGVTSVLYKARDLRFIILYEDSRDLQEHGTRIWGAV